MDTEQWIQHIVTENPPDEQYYQELIVKNHGIVEQQIRLLLTSTLNQLPYPVYRFIVDVIKWTRRSQQTQSHLQFVPGAYMQAVLDNYDAAPVVRICLTHDIDTVVCATHWRDIINLELRYGIRSTSNVLTDGPYTLDHSWLDELEAQGFEIGLHGDTHDMAIGFRPPDQIRSRLKRCLDKLDRQIIGYRAPALGISGALLKILDELGFRYDSSARLNLFYRKGVPFCLPYLYPETSLWQLPLALQDDGLFRDQRLNDTEALSIFQDIVNILSPVQGIFVFNSHPIHLKDRLGFYESLLTWIVEHQIEVVLAGDLVRQLDVERIEGLSN